MCYVKAQKQTPNEKKCRSDDEVFEMKILMTVAMERLHFLRTRTSTFQIDCILIGLFGCIAPKINTDIQNDQLFHGDDEVLAARFSSSYYAHCIGK